MNEFEVLYLVGALLGELVLLAMWAMKQTRKVSPMDYITEKWGAALLSGTLALICCIAWGEGTIATWVSTKFAGVQLTRGLSVIAGAAIVVFAHGIVWKARKKLDLDPDPDPDPLTPKGD